MSKTRGSEPSPSTWGRKDKSHDAIFSFEGWIAKLELGATNTKGDVDLLDQRIEEAIGDMQGEIRELQEGMQGSPIHAVSHKEFMAFQDKVLSVLTRLESRVDALRRNVEA